MNDHRIHAREGGASLLALAFAGIAAYAGYRAVDAERRLKDPNAKPLMDHIVETAKADMKSFCSKASELGAQVAEEARAAGEKVRAAASEVGDKAKEAASNVRESASNTTTDARTATADAADVVGDAAHRAASETRPN